MDGRSIQEASIHQVRIDTGTFSHRKLERVGTGTHSYYTSFHGNEIMFHVAPMIPIVPEDPIRKRYVGNDIVVILFRDSRNQSKVNPLTYTSQFNRMPKLVWLPTHNLKKSMLS